MKLNFAQLRPYLQKIKWFVQQHYQQFQALPVEKRKGLIKGAMLFVSGILVGVLVTLGIMKTGGESDKAHTSNAPVVANPNATDWGDLIANMCQTKSPVNLLAMKLDFPFSQCMRDNGQIDAACVQQDSKRFQPTLPSPYQHNLGAMETKIAQGEDGLPLMYYVLPLKDAAFQQLPLTALAVHIQTKVGNAPLGWQTPHVVIQGDYSVINSMVAQHAPPPQVVYYANIPANSEALPGPFANLDEAKIATRRAGGKTSLIKKHRVALEAHFLDGVNEVALSCVSQPVK